MAKQEEGYKTGTTTGTQDTPKEPKVVDVGRSVESLSSLELTWSSVGIVVVFFFPAAFAALSTVAVVVGVGRAPTFAARAFVFKERSANGEWARKTRIMGRRKRVRLAKKG